MKKYDFTSVIDNRSDIFSVLCSSNDETIRVDNKNLYLFYLSPSIIGIKSYNSYIGYIKYVNTTPYPYYKMYIYNKYKHFSRTTSRHINYLKNYFDAILCYSECIYSVD